jgi:hypothetical protein
MTKDVQVSQGSTIELWLPEKVTTALRTIPTNTEAHLVIVNTPEKRIYYVNGMETCTVSIQERET